MSFSVIDLINAAMSAREKAYAPYSGYLVGSAILTVQGHCYTGCNVENVSFGLTCCAERVALYKAVSEGERNFRAIAVTAGTDEYCVPCGLCRQALAEFGLGIEVHMVNRHGHYRTQTLEQLLPMAFGKAVLAEGRAGFDKERV